MKKFLQILGGVAYALFYSVLLTLIVLYGAAWLMSLSWVWILIIALLGGFTVVSLLNMFALSPLIWTAKGNMASAIASIVVMLAIFIWDIIRIWIAGTEIGTQGVVYAIVATLILLHCGFRFFMVVMMAAGEEDE